jgi:hypothetical protein
LQHARTSTKSPKRIALSKSEHVLHSRARIARAHRYVSVIGACVSIRFQAAHVREPFSPDFRRRGLWNAYETSISFLLRDTALIYRGKARLVLSIGGSTSIKASCWSHRCASISGNSSIAQSVLSMVAAKRERSIFQARPAVCA